MLTLFYNYFSFIVIMLHCWRSLWHKIFNNIITLYVCQFDNKEPWTLNLEPFISRSLFFFSLCIKQSVFRLLPLLNDEYTLPTPAGKESYCHSRMRSSYVLLGRRLKSLRCVPVRHMAKTQRREATQQSGSVCLSFLVSAWCVRALRR